MARSSPVTARLGEGRRRIPQPMQRSSGNAQGLTGGDGTQCRDSLDGGVHSLLSSLSTVARGIPNRNGAFFLNINDDLGAGQPLRQMAVLLLQLTHFVEERIAFRLGTALAGSQAPVALLAPVSKVRGVETLAAEHGAHRPGRLG